MAEHAAEGAEGGFLLYLIDMAILETKRRSLTSAADGERSAEADSEAPDTVISFRP